MLDLLLSLIIWLIRTILIPILPVEIGFFPIATYQGILDGVKPTLIYSLSGLSSIIDITLLFNLLAVMIFAELLLLIFKASVFLINIGRGSGA